MEDVRSVVTPDSQGSKTFSPRGLEGQSGPSLDTESQDSVKSYTFFRRCRGTRGQEGVIQYPGTKHQFNIGAVLKKSLKRERGMVHSTLIMALGRQRQISISLRPAWPTESNPGHLGLYSETLPATAIAATATTTKLLKFLLPSLA